MSAKIKNQGCANSFCCVNKLNTWFRAILDHFLMRRSTRNFNILPTPHRAKPEHYWIVQIPAPLGQNSVQTPYPVVGFLCRMPLLNNNRRRLLSSIKLVYKHANTSRDPFYYDAVCEHTSLILKLLKMTWKWRNYHVGQSQYASVSSTNSKTQQSLFDEGTEYMSTTEPRAFATVCILNCSVSVDYL